MILLLNRSFHPDTEATGQFLSDLAAELAKSLPVTALCGRSFRIANDMRGLLSREEHRGVRILRVRHTRFSKERAIGRLLNWLTYAGMTFLAALRERPRYLFVQTDPPILGPLALLLCRLLRCGMVFNCRDLYPDVALELGAVKPGLASGLLDALNRRAFREAVLTVALGDDMARRIEAKGVPRERILVIPDWVDTNEIAPVPAAGNPYAQGRFTFMYSGNIGLTQDFDVVLEALAGLKADRTRWTLLFVGGGAARPRIEARLRDLGLDNVVLLPPQPREKLSALLSAGNLHFVPMKPRLAGCVVPSKIYGIMAAGRPYLAVSDPECDMARLAREERCGLWAPAGDVEAVRRELERALEDPTALDAMGRRGRELAVARYDARLVMGRWVHLFSTLLHGQSA